MSVGSSFDLPVFLLTACRQHEAEERLLGAQQKRDAEDEEEDRLDELERLRIQAEEEEACRVEEERKRVGIGRQGTEIRVWFEGRGVADPGGGGGE